MVVSSFKQVFKKIEKTINTSQNQALNRAATSAKAFYAKETSKELGVPSARVKARAKIFKPNETNNNMTLSIGVRNQFAAQEFKSGKTKVSTRFGPRWTANYTVKGKDKVSLPGAFMTSVSNTSKTKKLILSRVGDARYPTKTVLVDVFRPAVERLVPSIQSQMVQSFEKNFRSQLEHNLSK